MGIVNQWTTFKGRCHLCILKKSVFMLLYLVNAFNTHDLCHLFTFFLAHIDAILALKDYLSDAGATIANQMD